MEFPDALSFLLDCSFNQVYIDGILATNQLVIVKYYSVDM